MPVIQDILGLLWAIPGVAEFWEAILAWWADPIGERLWEFVKFFFQLLGLWEFGKYLYRWIFRRRSHLELKVELLEEEVDLDAREISKLRSENKQLGVDLKDATHRLPQAAIARADHEWRDRNTILAIRQLERWFEANAESITTIALRLAKFHISRTIPDPGDHIERAHDMLRLARGASPHNGEADELSSELDRMNAVLQEQMIRDGDAQIAWNSAMMPRPGAQGDEVLPAVIALRDIARFCFEKGLWRLMPIFADQAAYLALTGGGALKRMWFIVETAAADYQILVGNATEGLQRVDHVLAEAQNSLPARDAIFFSARHVRAASLQNLGRYDEALAEINAFAPIEAEVKGARHPDTLSTRFLRAKVLQNLGRYGEALIEIDAFAPIETEVKGARHPNILTTRYLRAGVLQNLGRYGEALIEIDTLAPIDAEVKGARHPDTLSARFLRASVLQNLGRHGEALIEIDTLAPMQVEVKGVRHSDTLNARYLRAGVLQNLGRYGEALIEIDALAPMQAEVKGARHPDTLSTRFLRASLLQNLGRYGEALTEIDAFAPIEAKVRGARHPDTLTTRCLRASVLQNLGRYGEALIEIDAFAPIETEVKGARHPNILTTRYLRAGVLQNLGRYGEALAAYDTIEPVYSETLGAHHSFVLMGRYRRAMCLANLERWDEALKEIESIYVLVQQIFGLSHVHTASVRSGQIGIEIATKRNVNHTQELRGIITTLAAGRGAHNESTLFARYRLSRLLLQQGHVYEARTEIIDTIAHFDETTDPGHDLLRSVQGLTALTEGPPTLKRLIV